MRCRVPVSHPRHKLERPQSRCHHPAANVQQKPDGVGFVDGALLRKVDIGIQRKVATHKDEQQEAEQGDKNSAE